MDVKNIALFLFDNGEILRADYDEYPEQKIKAGNRTFTIENTRLNRQKTIRWITYEEVKS
jgi:hypothetical protein